MGFNCSIVRPIDLYNLSCVFNEELRPFERMKIIPKSLYAFRQVDQYSDGKNLLGLYLTMFFFTSIALSFLIYDERVKNKEISRD